MSKEDGMLKDDEIDLLDYVRIIIKHKITILFFFTLSLLMINYLIYLSPQLYEANSKMHVGAVVNPLMTAQDAGHLLEKNRISIISSLGPHTAVSVTHLLSMHNSGRIVFKKAANNDLLSISVIDKNGSRAVGICNAISSMLKDEGNKIYNKERQIVNTQIHEYEVGRVMINEQLIFLKDRLFKQESISRTASLLELENFYEKKYEPLSAKVLELKEKLGRAQDFWLIRDASYAENYNRLSFNQILSILGFSLIIGIVFIFFQEFWSNNFK